MAPDHVRDRRRALVRGAAVQPGRVVRAEPGEGSDRAPAPGAGTRAAALRVPARLGAAAPGGLGREPEARAAAVPARGAATPDAGMAAQAPGARRNLPSETAVGTGRPAGNPVVAAAAQYARLPDLPQRRPHIRVLARSTRHLAKRPGGL
ncbi:MAG: hypothetical protein AVDCRST_MAG11-179 [uncultured Gemmatimonadaceae bacterium]|uniref:Uncharacterized protein n=1 Tax=uncultured Gemmatimonadaceae bacterium TaxID=246130 RepID=A0A6J4JZY9_9BACT|nr:MAG: hypothetical protein AVDCRST_MAG11-179 [uncultured Gemmatimonadaceae bacterium]